jgi:preprotein translocase subunit SecD
MTGFARFIAAAVLAACCAGAALAQVARDVLVLEVNPDALRAEVMRVAEQQGGDALVPDDTQGKMQAPAIKRHDLPADQMAAIGRPRFAGRVEGTTLELSLFGEPATEQGMERVAAALPGFDVSLRGDGTVVAVLTPDGFAERHTAAVELSRSVLMRRLQAAGVTNATVNRGEDSRLLVSAPADELSDDVIELMLARGMVGWHRVDSTHEGDSSRPPVAAAHGLKALWDDSIDGVWRMIEVRPLIFADEIASALAGFDMYDLPSISFTLTDSGRLKFAEATRKLMGSAFAIVLDDRILSAPTIQSEITSGTGLITGDFTERQTRMLAAAINGGVLPLRLDLVERRSGLAQ